MRRRCENASNAFEMSTAMAIVLLGGLRWLKLEKPLQKFGAGRGGGLPLFEAVLGGASTQCLHDGREEESLQYLHWEPELRDGR